MFKKTRMFLLMPVLFTLSALLTQQSVLAAELSSPDLDSALSVYSLTMKDFESDRIWAEDDTFLLSSVRQAMLSPQAAYRVAHDFSDATPVSVEDLGSIYAWGKFLDAECPAVVKQDIDAQLAAAPPAFSDPFQPMLSAFALASGYRGQAFTKLTQQEQTAMLISAPLWFEDSDNASDDSLKGMIHRAFGAAVDTLQKVSSDSVLTLLSKVNREALAAAAYAFARGIAITVTQWKTTKPPFMTAMLSGVDGLVLATRETPYGTFVMGGQGPNTYKKDFAMILDLGGDDTYLGRVGAGVGNINSGISVSIDLNGNDQYISNKNCEQGCGILGLGALVDLTGNDTYLSGSFSQAASFCGIGILFDGGGDDSYRGGLFSQSASVCGNSLLIDKGGRDVYDAFECCQAYASTFAAAALIDGGGNDIYRAGGWVTHAPLRPEDYRSEAQGFAIGARPRAGGGIGLLHDFSGNDFYNGEVYAQGVGYWYSLGALFDDAGNDNYSATQYAQGAGIHLAAGVLEDGSGDDQYHSRFGPGQGGAHDLAVGVLYDHKGDDQYAISGGQAIAITNSAAIFYDAAGNDLYSASMPLMGQAFVRNARDFGNLALFVDGEGQDIYPLPSETDSSTWLHIAYGVGYDASRNDVTSREAPVGEITLQPSDTARSIEDIFDDASLWEVTDNRMKVRRARKALIAKGIDAVKWVGENKMSSVNALERRAMIELFKEFPDAAAPYLQIALDSGKRANQKNAIAIFGEMKYKPAVNALTAKLDDPSFAFLRPSILFTLGDIKEAAVTPTIIKYAKSSAERERIAATTSLGKLQDIAGWETICENLEDEKYTVRTAAIAAIAAQSPDIFSKLQEQFSTREIPKLEALLFATQQLAVRWSGDEKLKPNVKRLDSIARQYLEHPSPRIQSAALAAAASIMDTKALSKLESRFSQSKDPILKSRWQEIKSKLK